MSTIQLSVSDAESSLDMELFIDINTIFKLILYQYNTNLERNFSRIYICSIVDITLL